MINKVAKKKRVEEAAQALVKQDNDRRTSTDGALGSREGKMRHLDLPLKKHELFRG